MKLENFLNVSTTKFRFWTQKFKNYEGLGHLFVCLEVFGGLFFFSGRIRVMSLTC